MTTRITSQLVEKNILQQRELDVRRRDLSAFADDNAKLMSASNAIVRTESLRRQAFQQQCSLERHYEDRVNAEQQDKRMQRRLLEQNQNLYKAMNKDAIDREREAHDIQRICDDSPELQELQKSLKLAYLNKERDVQFQDKINFDLQERDRLRAMEDQMEHYRLESIKADAGKLDIKRVENEKQRILLAGQLKEREEREMQKKQDVVNEKQMVVSIMNRIAKEDQDDAIRRRSMQAETAKVMKQSAADRAKELFDRKMKEKEEEEEIMNYNKSMDARLSGVAAKKQAKRDEDDRILRQIVEETERKRAAEEEFNSLRDMLWEEELEAKRAKEQASRVQKQADIRQEMMDANEHMLQVKEEMKVQDKHEEMRMMALMKQKFAADEAKERMEVEKHQQAKVKHLSLIEQQKQQKMEMAASVRSNREQEDLAAEKREVYKRKVVEEARARLLEEHAAQLGNYMPGSAFKDKDEFLNYRSAADKRK